MGTLAPDTGSGHSDMHPALGLRGMRKGALGAPRVLKLLSSHLQRSVQINEDTLETTETKDTRTIFHGLRAPTLSIYQYIDRIFKFFNNAYYARVGGVSTSEMNRLEMKFLFSIDFRLQVNVNTFERYCSRLDKEATDGFQIERPIQACRLKVSWLKKDDSTTCTCTR